MASNRFIALDTETTGLNAEGGDRIIEIGCVAIEGRALNDDATHHLQLYINPEREVPDDAIAIHGITNEFLADKPVFAQVVDEFLAFVKGATLIIHNATFDVGFLNMELGRLDKGRIEDYCEIIDSLKLAKQVLPGKPASLNSLCRHYEIDNSARVYHGALLDAQLLAEVYLALSRGQDALSLDEVDPNSIPPIPDPSLFVVKMATEAELSEHERILGVADKKCKGTCAWHALASSTPEATS